MDKQDIVPWVLESSLLGFCRVSATFLLMPKIEALEQVLRGYEGTLLFVSHDRRFVSLLAEQLWIVQDGAFTVFDGGFEKWAQLASTRQSAQPGRRASARCQAPPLASTARRALPTRTESNPDRAALPV